MDPIPFSRVALSAALLLAVVWPLGAQDVELLGRIHGTRPPDGYFDIRRDDPSAFEFTRAWKARSGLGRSAGDGDELPATLDGQDLLQSARVPGLGRREPPVNGTFTFPVVLGTFAGTSAAYTREEVQREFFDGPAERSYGTISEYYQEVSGGRVDVRGETFGWHSSTLDQDSVAGSDHGLGSDARVGEFIEELVEMIDDGSVNWGLFDNDGPDGIPNSGDDDGYVDVLAVMHPMRGAECPADDADAIWSHKWHLSASGSLGRAIETSSSAEGGGSIRIDDYVIVPLHDCDGERINTVGVLTHELGHGFGLPDLYGTGDAFVAGAGNWDLMATGSWGCGSGDGAESGQRPCHLGAWTKYVMGWVDVDTIPAGAGPREVSLDPVATSGRILRVESNDDSGEYFLLEHRRNQEDLFDDGLYDDGLLVWHVDPSRVDARWRNNRVNADTAHAGVWLRQADGLNELMATGGFERGDAGDVFPGSEAVTSYHGGTEPSSYTHAGAPSGLTITGIENGETTIRFELENRSHMLALDRPNRLELVAAEERELLLQVEDASIPAEWTLVEGRLAEGLELLPEGSIVGAALEDGVFPVELEVRDGTGLHVRVQLELTVTPPAIGIQALAAALVDDEEGPTAVQEAYLDRGGNRNGQYDIGDLRAFMSRHPDHPETVAGAAGGGAERVTVPAGTP